MEEGRVIPPPGYREIYKFLKENGWGSSSECIRLPGGMRLILYPDFFRKIGSCPNTVRMDIAVSYSVLKPLRRIDPHDQP